MKYEVRSAEDGYEVYDNWSRQTVATFQNLKGEKQFEGDNAHKRAHRYMAQLIVSENLP